MSASLADDEVVGQPCRRVQNVLIWQQENDVIQLGLTGSHRNGMRRILTAKTENVRYYCIYLHAQYVGGGVK